MYEYILWVILGILSQTELSASQTNLEERLDHEAQELEKRLSLLSHQSSTGTARLMCAGIQNRKKGVKLQLNLTNFGALNVGVSS